MESMEKSKVNQSKQEVNTVKVKVKDGAEVEELLNGPTQTHNGPGIHITPPCTPQHIGVSERMNRTLLDMIQSMMNLTTLPLSFWDYALENATRILNMVPTKKVDKIPYELWYEKVPNLSYLKELKIYSLGIHITPPCTPQHIGVSERMNRTLLDMIQSMMNLTTLPLSFWDYALENATRILNMVPTKKVDKIPYELCERPEELKEIQDKDTSPSEITSEISMGLKVLNHLKRRSIEVEEYSLRDLNEPANYKAAILDPKTDKTVCKLQRTIYSLKQASRSWNKRSDEEIKKFGFVQNLDEPCVYQKAIGSNVTFLILYVDDIIIMGNHIPSLQSVKSYLGKCFAMKYFREAEFILGIKIYRDRSKRLIRLSQFSLEPGLSNLNETGKSSNPTVSQVLETSKKDLVDLFHNFYDEYFDASKVTKALTTNVKTSNVKIPSHEEEVFHEKEVMVPPTNTQLVSNESVPNVNEESTSHNVFNERLEDAYFDASMAFHDPFNVHTFCQPYPNEKKWTKDHSHHKIIGDPKSSVHTRGQIANSCLFLCFLSSIESANVAAALTDVDWVSAMQEELNQFARLKVWRLASRLKGKTIINTKWIFKNKKDESSLVIRNKARLVTHGYCQQEGIDYDETFAPVA
nr:retrotransposon protein, putative, Ty1-copia subclass [Tanacetum cinerariifolium]